MDIMSRLIAPKLAERPGQNVVVDNRAGAAAPQVCISIPNIMPCDHMWLPGKYSNH